MDGQVLPSDAADVAHKLGGHPELARLAAERLQRTLRRFARGAELEIRPIHLNHLRRALVKICDFIIRVRELSSTGSN